MREFLSNQLSSRLHGARKVLLQHLVHESTLYRNYEIKIVLPEYPQVFSYLYYGYYLSCGSDDEKREERLSQCRALITSVLNEKGFHSDMGSFFRSHEKELFLEKNAS